MHGKIYAQVITINVPLFKKLRDNLRGQKSLGPLKMSLEMAQKVIVPKKNYVPKFLKQRDIGKFPNNLNNPSSTYHNCVTQFNNLQGSEPGGKFFKVCFLRIFVNNTLIICFRYFRRALFVRNSFPIT